MKAFNQCFQHVCREYTSDVHCIVGVFCTTAFKNCLFSKIQVKTIMMTPEKN